MYRAKRLAFIDTEGKKQSEANEIKQIIMAATFLLSKVSIKNL